MYRRRGMEPQAQMVESLAAELEAWWRRWWLEELGLEAAAEELGVSYSTMQKRVAENRVPNVGRRGSPRVRRADLFPGLSGERIKLADGSPDLAGEILLRRGTG